jgi:hypothetical protein
MPKDHYCGGGIHPDNDTWFVRVRFKPVLSIPHENWGSYFVQMTGDEAFLSFSKELRKAKREGRILDYLVQHIDHFWSVKEFERKVMRRVKPKRKR